MISSTSDVDGLQSSVTYVINVEVRMRAPRMKFNSWAYLQDEKIKTDTHNNVIAEVKKEVPY